MSATRPLIALISATPLAIRPAAAAVTEAMGDADVWNILDDRLMAEAESRGGLDPALRARMGSLIDFAVGQGADAVLLTCSLYGAVAEGHDGPVPTLGPDGAVFDEVVRSSWRRVLVVASFDEARDDSIRRLREAAAQRGRAIEIIGLAVPAARASSASDDPSALIDDLAGAVTPMLADLDAVLLAQYSLAPARAELERRLERPVLSGAVSAARRLRAELERPAETGILGVIADDYTGAIDVADALRSAGLRTLLLFGIDEPAAVPPGLDAIVVALKTRSVAAQDAVDRSLAALSLLQQHGVDQVYLKYCSTFDSTPRGNIGPVLDALAAQTHADVVLTTPSSPMHGRIVRDGLLFVDGVPLAQSHMARHPLNPMTDSLLTRLLAPQTGREVRTLSLDVVRAGPDAVARALEPSSAGVARIVIADAIEQRDLDTLAATQPDAPLLAGAAGLALAIGRARAQRTRRRPASPALVVPPRQRRAAVLAGSCSQSTLAQVARFREGGHPAHRLVASPEMTAEGLVADALRWFDALPGPAVPLFYASADAEERARVDREVGGERASRIFEEALAGIASALRERGIDRFVVAGGETSGAVTGGLGVRGGVVGGRVDEGVAWLYSTPEPSLALLLKSGNFGSPDLFLRAIDPGCQWGESHR